ncbi:MAG: DUF11 domain-containing protein [Acidobacteriota bacterium]
MSPEELESHLDTCDPDRRDFLKSLILGTAYAAPLVTSFGMGGLGVAPAEATVGGSLANLCDPLPSNIGADVVINKVSSPKRATAGEPLSYFIEVYNCGPDPAISVVVTDTLPLGTFFVSSSQVEGDVTFAITDPPVDSEGAEWRAIAKGLAVGGSARFEIIVRVAP